MISKAEAKRRSDAKRWTKQVDKALEDAKSWASLPVIKPSMRRLINTLVYEIERGRIEAEKARSGRLDTERIDWLCDEENMDAHVALPKWASGDTLRQRIDHARTGKLKPNYDFIEGRYK